VREDLRHRTEAQRLITGGSQSTTGPGSSNSSNTSLLNSQETTYVQSAYSVNSLERFVSQVAELKARNSSVKTYAQKLIDDHARGQREVQHVASAYKVKLPSGILTSQDNATARQILLAMNSSNFDDIYLNANVQTHTLDLANNKTEVRVAQNPSVKQLAMNDIPTDTLHLIGAQTLLKNKTVTGA